MVSELMDLEIAGERIALGERKQVDVLVAKLYDYTEIAIPVEVVRGTEPGPILFVSAAVHGDEINGVEVVKRLLAKRKIGPKMRGTLIAAPIVNVFGFNRNSRYLPDRRDLNRCFPGSAKGSLAGQIANLFMKEVVEKSTHGIDLHTGAIHRYNLPQIRACLSNPENQRLADAFAVPVVIDANIRDGSLRQAAAEKGIPMLLFEGGEALRYDEKLIRSAVKGIMSVMETIDMLSPSKAKSTSIGNSKNNDVFVARSSHWIRAPHSGSLRIKRKCGDRVRKGTLLGVISNPFGQEKVYVRARRTGIIIGMTMLPLVNNGDALFHIATFEDAEAVEESLEAFDESLDY